MGDVYEIFDEDSDQPIDRFEVRDLRVQTRFALDNAFYDEFMPHLNQAASLTYIALVRHANKEQKTWPSQKRIADQLGMTRQWVGIQLQVLECFNLIRKVRVGKMCTNRYYLVDEKYWRRDYNRMVSELAAAMKFRGFKLPKDVMQTELSSLKVDVMQTELSSLMTTGLSKAAISNCLQCAVGFASNSKDKQSKDNQEKSGSGSRVKKKKTVKKTGRAVTPTQSRKYEYEYDSETRTMKEIEKN